MDLHNNNYLERVMQHHLKHRLACAVSLAALATTASVHAVVAPATTAYGALSNFDVYNDTSTD